MSDKDPWLEALEQITRMAQESQARFEENMTTSQARFLETLEHAQRALVELANARSIAPAPHSLPPNPAPTITPTRAHTAREDEAAKGILERVLRPFDTSTPRRAVHGLTRPIAITPDRQGLYLELSSALLEAGLAPHIVQGGEPIPRAAGVVLWCEALVGVEDTDEANLYARHALEKFAALEAHLAGGAFITLRDTGGDLGWNAVELAGAPFGAVDGLAIARDHDSVDGAQFLSIDINTRRPQAEVARQLTGLLLEGLPHGGCAALSGGRGRAPKWRPVELAPPAQTERSGTVIFTGGAPPPSLASALQEQGARIVRVIASALQDQDAPQDRPAPADIFDNVLEVPSGDSMTLYHTLEDERQERPITGWIHTLERDGDMPWWEERALEEAIWSAVATLGCTMTDALEQILLLEPLEEQRDEEISDSITHRMHAELLRAMARVERNRRDVATRVRFITYDPADEAMLLLAAFGSGPLEGVELWCKGS